MTDPALREKMGKAARERVVQHFDYRVVAKRFDGKPKGQDWQTWSAALYLYAAKCVEEKRTPFFEEIRDSPLKKRSF